jgi:hypothetical protein
MGQVTIYLDREAERKARAAARAQGVSLSKWVTERVRRGAQAEWPASVQKLAGAWPDLPSSEQIRKGQGRDARRGRL